MRVASYTREIGMFGNGVKNGIRKKHRAEVKRKKHRAEVKNGDKKDGRLGGKVQLSRFGWDARPLGIVPRWKVGICGTESTGKRMPDRLVLFPGGKLGFVELKAPGKKMRPLQEKRKRTLEELGFLVFCVDSKEMIGGVLHEIRTL